MLSSNIERLSSHVGASASTRVPAPARRCRGIVWSKKPSQDRVHVCHGLDRDTAAAAATLSVEYEAVPLSEAQIQQGTSTHVSSIDESQVVTRFIAETLLPTRHGKFRLRGYKHSVDGGVTFTEPSAILTGQVNGLEDVPVRVHDACFTSEVLGSLKCDCAEQLQLALEFIETQPPGIVIYLQQEGRGIGLANKIAAYALQESGLDTVDANRALGLPDDCREYTSVRNILADLGVASIRLMTNNPRKIGLLTSLGIKISGRIPCQVAAGKFNKGYLEAKRERMDHLLDGSWCYWNHDGEPVAFSKGGMGLPEQGFKMPDGQLIMPTGGSRFSSGASSSAVEASVAQEQQAGQGQQQQQQQQQGKQQQGKQQQGKQQQGKQQQGKQQEQQQRRAELQ